MQILPYVGDIVVSSQNVRVLVNPDDRDRIEDLVVESSAITKVINPRQYEAARGMAARLKALLNEITESAKAAKRPGNEVNEKVGTLAKDISMPVVQEHSRVLNLLNVYVIELERERERVALEQRKAQEEAERKITQAKAEAALAKTEAQRAKAQLEAARAQLDKEMLKAQTDLAKNTPIAPGIRVAHPWQFELVDPAAVIQSGNKRLLRIELDILSCQDEVKRQLEKNPDKEPRIMGIKVWQETRVSVKASA